MIASLFSIAQDINEFICGKTLHNTLLPVEDYRQDHERIPKGIDKPANHHGDETPADYNRHFN